MVPFAAGWSRLRLVLEMTFIDFGKLGMGNS